LSDCHNQNEKHNNPSFPFSQLGTAFFIIFCLFLGLIVL
jgi:hypothetical protein